MQTLEPRALSECGVCVCVCGIVLFFLGWCWFLGGVGSSWGGGVRVGNCRRGG